VFGDEGGFESAGGGYGAPGSEGSFPPLNSYTRNTRNLELALDIIDAKELDIRQVIKDLEIDTGADHALGDASGDYALGH
jgi:hypothetical protein